MRAPPSRLAGAPERPKSEGAEWPHRLAAPKTTAAAAQAGMSRQRTAQKSIERVLGFVFTDSLSTRRVLAPGPPASATDLATSSSDWESVSANVSSEPDREKRARGEWWSSWSSSS